MVFDRTTIELLLGASLVYHVHGQPKPVFRELDLRMDPGTCLALIGPNACGKSSLLRAILGLVCLDEGTIGVQLSRRDLLGAVLQDYRSQLLPWASVADNLTLPLGGENDCDIRETDLIEGAERFLHLVGYDIPMKKRTRYLSGGQQQAVVLARALAFGATFLCWDEPTSAIDFPKRGLLYQHLQREWSDRGSSVVLVSHDVDEALLLGDRVVVFDAEMHVLFDELVQSSARPRDRDFLETESARRLHLDIRSAMMGNG